MNDQDLRIKCFSKLYKLARKANEDFIIFLEEVDFNMEFDLTGRTAGMYYYKPRLIRLNMQLLQEYRDEFIEETVTHEFCHGLADVLFDRTTILPHGYEWRLLMNHFGVPADRTHNYDVKVTARPGEALARCSCKEFVLSKIRTNKMLKHGADYFCRKCREPLKLVKIY